MSLRLKMMREADGPRVLAWRNSEAVAPFMYTDHVISPEEHRLWLLSALAAPDRRYWIIELEGAPVGLVSLVGISKERSRAEWAYYLAEPSARGRGVGAAVEFVMIEQAFQRFLLHKLWCEVLVENATVIAMHERFGFRREAYLRHHVWKDGGWRDVVGLGLLADDWADLREASSERLRARGYDPLSLRCDA